MSNRVLVVDDHHAFRETICSVLQQSGRWQLLDEASDGLTAVEKAQRLQPGLIVMDVTLPLLNGLDAAKQILALRPDTKILFVSMHRSFDIVEAALATGARGYVFKGNHDELLPALEAVAAGRCYLSAAFTARHGRDTHSHEIGFCNDTVLLHEYARFGAAALHAGKALVFIAREARRWHLRSALQADGIDIDRAVHDRRYIEFEIADLLSQFVVDDRIDEERFWRAGTAIFLGAKAATGGRAGVAVCGDGTATLLHEGKSDAALRLEQLWDEFARMYNVDVFCGYPPIVEADDAHRDVVRRICEAHSAVRVL